ncbi:MAG: tandem-95 repeat protein, partial [Actinobacteria bacterium]|nr:tandem-95 repeat protein [Actinomycetota bacterium]
FTYTANDGVATSPPATVTITVAPYEAPVAVDNAYSTGWNTPLDLDPPGVLLNDTAANGLTLTAALVSGPAHGSLIFRSDGSFTYTPDNGFSGPDTFTYVANDGISSSAPASVTITVAPQPPPNDNLANAQPIFGPSGSVTGSDVSATEEVGEPQHIGDFYGLGTTSIWYDWTAPADGEVTFSTCRSRNDTETYDDGWLDTIVEVFTGTSYDTFTLVASNDDDPDGCGGGREWAAGSVVTFTATAGTVYHIAVDSWSPTDIGTVILDWAQVPPPNTPPVAADDAYTAISGTPLVVNAPGVLANDSDPDADALTAGSASDPAGGSVILNADGSFTYTPDAGFTGTDTFTYAVSDGKGGTAMATVTITVILGCNGRAATVVGTAGVDRL